MSNNSSIKENNNRRMLRLSSKTLNFIKTFELGKPVFNSYNKIMKYIEKGPIENYLYIKKEIEIIEQFIKKNKSLPINEKPPLKQERFSKKLIIKNKDEIKALARKLDYSNDNIDEIEIQKTFLSILKSKIMEDNFLEIMNILYNNTHSRNITPKSEKFLVWVIDTYPSLIHIDVDILEDYYPDLLNLNDTERLKEWPLEKLYYYCKINGIQALAKEKKEDYLKKIKDYLKIFQEGTKEEETSQGSSVKEMSERILVELISFTHALNSEILNWKNKFRAQFAPILNELLKEINLKLEGHYPILKISFFTIEVNFDNPKVIIWYGPQHSNLDICNLNPQDVFECIKKHYEELTNREFDARKYFEYLFKAYEMVICQNKKDMGDQAPILEILLNLIILSQDEEYQKNPSKKLYKEYTRIMFSYDLYKLKTRRSENLELSLITATRAYTTDISTFIWIPSNDRGDGRTCSHIQFKVLKNG